MRLLPRMLKENDTIGIVSPSDAVNRPEEDANLQSGIRFLKKMGFKTLLAPHNNSKKPQKKAQDINELFLDKNVKAIFCSQGGQSAEKTLQFIDWNAVRQHPKIFMGLSDITVLLNAFNSKTGLVTFHGNDVRWGFGRNPTAFDSGEIHRVLMRGECSEIPANRRRKTIRKGRCKGKLLGGNLFSLLKLAKTEYWPNFDNAILFIEDVNPTQGECITMLERLQKENVFEKISGAIVGYVSGMKTRKNNPKQLEELLFETTSEKNFPILKMNDFGHNIPNTIIPLGTIAEMDADNKTIRLVEKYVI